MHARPAWVRGSLLALGWLSVALGVIGIFLPLLPTTPFLLLAAACFARSSPRVYHWLVSHPRLGPWIQQYLDGDGMPLRAKVWAIVLLWLGIGLSCLWVDVAWLRVLLILTATAVTGYIASRKTLHRA